MSDFDDRINAAMDRCADGDDAAFNDVYAMMGPRLLSWFQRQGASREQSEDLLQEVALRLFRARGGFQHGASAMAWAYGISRNAWIDHLRAVQARPRVVGDESALGRIRASEASSADASTLTTEQVREIERVLEGLPEAQREAFELRHVEHLDIAAAARRAGVSENALKIRVHRAVEALRRAFDRPSGGHQR